MAELLRGVAFQFTAYALLAAMGVLGAPVVLWSRRWTRAWCGLYARSFLWLAGAICGLKCEVRGPVPKGDVVVAAKHQSMLDVFMLFDALPHPRFIMKRELLWVPIFGLYANRIETISVNRSEKGAGDRMLADVERRGGGKGQIVIYPQGTRVAPGVKAPFKKGAIRAYRRFGLPMVLAATNVGVFFPRRSWAIRPGTAVVEFGETLPAGLPEAEVGERMRTLIERESERLVEEARADRTERVGQSA